MKNKKAIVVSAVLGAIVCLSGCGNSAEKENKDDIKEVANNEPITLDDATKEKIKELNSVLDEYYIKAWDNNKFLSFFSYLAKYDKSEVTIEEIEKTMGYTLPESLKNVSIHFVKPASLKPYLQDKMSDEDLEILTVYTAFPVKDGVFISSKYDEGKVITNEEYKKFVLEQSWEHGEVKTPAKDSKEYKAILSAIETADENLKGGNVKYIACDDKYAIIVISSKQDPAYIKEFALQKTEDEKYNIIVNELETVDSKIFINYAYTDFNLDMLPIYEISSYPISSEVMPYVTAFKESKDLGENEELTYGCSAGEFTYLEFKSGLKLLVYTNQEGISDIYEVDNYKTAIEQMTKLSSNPPVFILNFE